MLIGKDYPHLCEVCRAAIDDMAMLYGEDGPDTDDEEAACMAAYDANMFCGGHICINKPSHYRKGNQ